MFVPILTDVFNHWFVQGTIPGSVIKSVIILLKKSGRHIWEGLYDYRPITLLNTVKDFGPVLATRLQLVICNLVGSEQNYDMKGRSIQDNLHLVHKVIEEIEDHTEAALINLDQSTTFDMVDYRFVATVFETAGFKPEFRKWISLMYHNIQTVVQVNGKCSGAFAIKRSVRQGCLLFPFLYTLVLEPLLRRVRDEKASPAVRWLSFGKVSAYADITVFVSRRLDIKAVNKVVARYEQIVRAKINFDKNEGLWLGA